MFCDQCGNLLRENSKFCNKCGAPVLQERAPVEQPVVVAAPPTQTVTPAPTVPMQEPAPSKSTTGKKVAIIVGVILGGLALIALIIILLVSLFKNRIFSKDSMESVAPPTDTYIVEDLQEDDEVPTLSEDNPYAAYYDPAVDYILPDSDLRYYSRAEISHLNNEQLELACREIEARHGLSFQDKDLQAYFNTMDWYIPGRVSELNHVEKINMELLRANQALLDNSYYQSGNPYTRYASGSQTYLIPDSHNRYLDSSDLKNLSADELQLVRSEIYARHGYICKTDALRNYFYCKDWYVPSIPGEEFDTSVFNKHEATNIELIKVYEKLKDGVKTSADNPYAGYYYAGYESIIADSSIRKLNEYDVMYMTAEQLTLARNEIYARKGYVCSDQHLFEYFSLCSWFVPESAPGDLDRIQLTSIESANAAFLKKYRDLVAKIPDIYELDTALTREVETPYFTVNVPKYFKNYCEVVKGKDDGVYNVKFYETISKDFDSELGRLFTITVVPSTKSISNYTNYEVVGSIYDTKGNAWNILVRFPAGVEWTEATYPLYTKMQEEVWRIMNTLSTKSGYTFSYGIA